MDYSNTFVIALAFITSVIHTLTELLIYKLSTYRGLGTLADGRHTGISSGNRTGILLILAHCLQHHSSRIRHSETVRSYLIRMMFPCLIIIRTQLIGNGHKSLENSWFSPRIIRYIFSHNYSIFCKFGTTITLKNRCWSACFRSTVLYAT